MFKRKGPSEPPADRRFWVGRSVMPARADRAPGEQPASRRDPPEASEELQELKNAPFRAWMHAGGAEDPPHGVVSSEQGTQRFDIRSMHWRTAGASDCCVERSALSAHAEQQ